LLQFSRDGRKINYHLYYQIGRAEMADTSERSMLLVAWEG